MSDTDWLEPIDRRIEEVRRETEAIKNTTAALKRLYDKKAWDEYCETSLDLSNQDDDGYPKELGDFVVT